MSEELESKYTVKGKTKGQVFGDFEYFQIGSATFNQLKKAKLIPGGYSSKYNSCKPDRIIVDRRNKAKPMVLAVIEDKKGGKFKSEIEKIKAIQQCNNYCQEVGAKIGIITDGNLTIWINPNEKNKTTEYLDELVNIKRSYTLLKKEDGSEIQVKFSISTKSDLPDVDKMEDSVKSLYKLILEIIAKTNSKNSIIKQPGLINPLPLARRVWQDIWAATGKSPEKCLYNVVELFIFKFLSDLEILSYPNDFQSLYKLIEKGNSPDEILQYYVKNCRDDIKTKFPVGADGTTIINGTIFVDEKGNANTTQSILFRDSLKKIKDFEKENGKFSTNNIDKDFKTKLYESFLKQTAGLKALGQFFTPRKVVRAIVEMSEIRYFKGGERFCDPFCGVGGFVLEPLNFPERYNDFRPKNGKIKNPITYVGLDKGFEKDEERTIILAKANMLIYLSEVIAESKQTQEFSNNVFNKTFRLIRSNLGTLGEIPNSEEEKYDLILTNPPYVKRGISTLKNEIDSDSDLKSFYAINSGGLEGLSVEWIIRNLKKGGSAMVIIPHGILDRIEDNKLREFILKECFINAIISLPQKTFYATPKKTYILNITKKSSVEEKQVNPVFTYLVSSIGETFDSYRNDTPEKNDLNELTFLFNQFKGSNKDERIINLLQGQSERCKIQPIEKFYSSKNWCVDLWWSQEDKVALGVDEAIETIDPSEFAEKLEETKKFFGQSTEQFKKIIGKKNVNEDDEEVEFVEEELSEIFDIKQGNSFYTKKRILDNSWQGDIPVYSSNTKEDGLLIKMDLSKIKKVDLIYQQCLTWSVDGYAGTIFIRNIKNIKNEKKKEFYFTTNNHCGLLIPKKENLYLPYIKNLIQPIFYEKAKGYGNNKVGSNQIKDITIKIPIKKDGSYDYKKQQELSQKFEKIDVLKKELLDQINWLNTHTLTF